MMKLVDAVRDLNSLDVEATIYAMEPWTPSSDVLIAREPAEGEIPQEAAAMGMRYFIEVFVARNFLENWFQGLGRHPTLDQTCERLIQFAFHDA